MGRNDSLYGQVSQCDELPIDRVLSWAAAEVLLNQPSSARDELGTVRYDAQLPMTPPRYADRTVAGHTETFEGAQYA